jgi:hypothetical protein
MIRSATGVSVFHSLGGETVKQGSGLRNTERNTRETKSLKAFALLALGRNNNRNKCETETNYLVSVVCGSETKLLPPDEGYTYEERAAIFEYDGGLSRAEAERLAYDFVKKSAG